MNKEKFWKTVEALDWVGDPSVSRIKHEMLYNFTLVEYREFYEEYQKYFSSLYDACYNWASKYGDLVEPSPRQIKRKNFVCATSNVIARGPAIFQLYKESPRKVYDDCVHRTYDKSFQDIWNET